MINLFPLLFFFFNINFYKIRCSDDNSFIIYPEQIQAFIINYDLISTFTFNNENDNNDDLIVNFHSINCEFKIIDKPENIEINFSKNDFYSLKIPNSLNKPTIMIAPIKDIIDGNYKYNYNIRNCPLTINSIFYKNKALTILNKTEPTIFYFDKNIQRYNITYKISDFTEDSFVTFLFSFNEITEFEINIFNSKNSIEPYIIKNSTNIFIDNKSLSEIKCNNCNLTILIENMEKKGPFLLTFKSIEKDSFSILDKNYLNKGFITSKTSYQYYYMEIYKGDEGEIMLHNKGQKGILFGKIVTKNESIIYPKSKDESKLFFNEHALKLNFNFSQTKKCEEGCYLLITYCLQNPPTITTIGYEFTLLSRIWDDYDLSPKIINIPFNEYIFGHFEEESINHHFYYFYIPNNIKQIIIQIEGNYCDGFIGGGKKKIITFKTVENDKNLNITSKQMVLLYNLTEINNENNYISLTFRSKDYFINTLSFYYFRLLYKKELTTFSNNILVTPLEPNIGNPCQPHQIIHEGRPTDNYYCLFILKNNYNQFSLNYSISTSNQNKDVEISYTKYYEDNTTLSGYIMNVFNDNDENVSFILFSFKFHDTKIKNVLLNFLNIDNKMYPQIYSSQIYQLSESTTNNFLFLLKNQEDYSLVVSRTQGTGYIKLDSGYPSIFYIAKNFRGNSIYFSLNNIQNVIFGGRQNFIFYIKLSYIGNNEVREVIYGETMNEIIRTNNFPLFYYINYNIKEFMYITLRILNYDQLNATTNYKIDGYILDYEFILKKIKGEYIQLKNPIKGNYNIYSNTGFLNINQSIIDNKYILILINEEKSNNYNNNENNNTNLIVQITPIYHNKNEFVLPVNQYITGAFNIQKENNENIIYYIQIDKNDLPNDYDVLVEFSSNCGEDLNITLESENHKILNIIYTNDNGFKTYRLKNLDDNFYFNISNSKNIQNANFILRYFFTKEKDEYKYLFNHNTFNKPVKKHNQDNTTFITFEFNNIQINASEILSEENKNNITFIIYGFLFQEKNIINKESINTFANIHSQPSNFNQTSVNANNKTFNISFNDISRDNFIYIMQIKVHVIINSFYINEQFLVYTFHINLEEDLIEDEKNYIFIYIIIGLIGLILIIIIISTILCYKMKKKNTELRDKVLAISFSSGISDDDLDNNKKKKGEDYETTFI